MLTKKEVIENVRTLTFRVAVTAAEYESALKPEVWPYRVAVRHYRAPRRERSEGSWEGQSERSGGNITKDEGGRNSGSRVNGSGGRNPSSGGRQHLPLGHPGRVGQHQQVLEKLQPGPIEVSNIYNVLAALSGGMGLPYQ